MLWDCYKIIVLFLFACASVVDGQLQHFEQAEEDSSSKSSAAMDSASARLFRPSRQKQMKSYNIHMTEYMMKANLARLSHYAQGQYLNPIYTLDELFIQANQFPEDVKNKMFGLALAGGAAREVFKHTRKQLAQRNIRFIYPNLYGLNVTQPVRPLDARFYVRFMSLEDRYYMLNLQEGRAYVYYRETPILYQRGINYQLYKRWRLFVQRAEYRTTAYNGFGISHSTKRVFLYAMYSQNTTQPEFSRAYLYINIHFDQ